MTIHKKPVEEKEHDSEKYRFMKEQVRPQQKKNAIKYILRGLICLKKKAVVPRRAVYGKKNRQKAFPSPPNNPIAYRCCCQGTWCAPPQAYSRYG